MENRRVQGTRVVQRQVLYLGEINNNQHAAWSSNIDVFVEEQPRAKQMTLFPEGRAAAVSDSKVVEIRLGDLQTFSFVVLGNRRSEPLLNLKS